MTGSATNLRQRRRAETSSRLNATARRLTAEHGMAGFTVEELCETVGVSRRTFFNHFASKEDAVLGFSVRHDHTEAEERFVAGGTAGGTAGGGVGTGTLSPALVDDLAELLIDRWELMDMTRDDARDLMAACEREPRLLARLHELTRTQERGDIALVQRRERLPAGDLRAGAVVHVLGAVLRMSIEVFFDPAVDEPFRDAFARRLAAARAVLAA